MTSLDREQCKSNIEREMERAIFGSRDHTRKDFPFSVQPHRHDRYLISGRPSDFIGSYEDLMAVLSTVRDGEGYGFVVTALRTFRSDYDIEERPNW